MPLEVYLRTSYEPDAEYVDGVIEERPAALWDHANWHGAVEEFFGSRRTEFGIRVLPSLRIRSGPNTIRFPDVTILDRNLPAEQFVTHPPIAVFEILSPEDSLSRMMTKLADYEGMGIKTILILGPTGQHFRYVAGRLEPLPPSRPTLACRLVEEVSTPQMIRVTVTFLVCATEVMRLFGRA